MRVWVWVWVWVWAGWWIDLLRAKAKRAGGGRIWTRTRTHLQRPPAETGRLGFLVPLLNLLTGLTLGVELRQQALTAGKPEGPLQVACSVPARATGEAARLDARGAFRADGDLDLFLGARRAAPPTITVTLIEPSSRRVSEHVWPFLRASILAFSTA